MRKMCSDVQALFQNKLIEKQLMILSSYHIIIIQSRTCQIVPCQRYEMPMIYWDDFVSVSKLTHITLFVVVVVNHQSLFLLSNNFRR